MRQNVKVEWLLVKLCKIQCLQIWSSLIKVTNRTHKHSHLSDHFYGVPGLAG